MTSGLAVLEVDIPTGYVVMNDTLRDYVQSNTVPNLRRAEFYGRKVVFYFDYVRFIGEKWSFTFIMSILQEESYLLF